MFNTLISHAVLVVCLTGMVWLKHVVTVQGEQATRLNLLAATDPLTGLSNRRLTLQLLDQLARDGRLDLAPVVLLCDLDHFKQINDGWGHAMGDQVLVAVASALRASTRDADTVARWGGEEFLVVLPVTRGSEAIELAERLRLRVEALQVADRHQCPVPVTLSIGIATPVAGESGRAGSSAPTRRSTGPRTTGATAAGWRSRRRLDQTAPHDVPRPTSKRPRLERVALLDLARLEALLNHCTRWAEVPCVKVSGCDGAAGLALQRVVADRVAAFRASSMSPASMICLVACALLAQMPAKQSACSSRRTDSALERTLSALRRAASTLSEMPSSFCTWWPTSCAIT